MESSKIKELAQDQQDYVVAMRREFHRSPELSGKEFHTRERLIEEIEKMGVPYEKLPGTGLIAIIEGGKPGKNKILRADIDALPLQEETENLKLCENTYWGYIEHFDALTNIQLTNQDSPVEKASAQILASYLDTDTKWGLFNGFSSRPMMPIATKMLFSKTKLPEDEALLQGLKVSREDIRLLKLYNMFTVL